VNGVKNNFLSATGSYSLRQRYIFITSTITALIIAFSWMAQSYVGESGHQHLKNIERRNDMTQLVRQLRTSVLEMEESLDAFMWAPGDEKRAAVHAKIDQAAGYFDKLKHGQWLNSLGYAENIRDFGIDIKGLHAILGHLMDTRVASDNNTPMLTTLERLMHKDSRAFIVAGTDLTDSFGTFTPDSEGKKLHHLLSLILQRWKELDNQLNLYIKSRTAHPGSDDKLQYQQRIDLLYGAIKMQLNDIRHNKAKLLTTHDKQLLDAMRLSSGKWREGYQQIKTSSPEEHLRTDIPYLKHTIEPHFAHIWRYLSELEKNIERYAAAEANQQQIITETIIDSVWTISLLGMLVLAMGFIYFERGILTPIARVARALKAEAQGDDDNVGLPRVNSRETQQLIDAFDEMRNQVKDRQLALEHQALHDSLTSLPNRYHWQNQLEKQCRLAQQNNQTFAVLMLGLDRFKDINDTLGHRIGDRILQLFGERVKCLLSDGQMVARLGSDEFGILLPNAGQEETIYTARKLLDEMEHPFQIEQINLYVGCSMGITLFPEHATKPSELTRFADIAMHVAKQLKTGYALYERKHDTNSILKLSMATDLRHAIQNNNLQLFYQPQQFLHNDEFAGMEILLRWRHPVHGFISPESFIPIAEQTGVIHPVTLWVLEQTFERLNRWNKMGRDPGLVSVNISVFNLQAADFVENIDRLMKKWSINPDKLMLEITETAMMADPINAKSTLDELNQLGIKLAIDDFGTGFSSLAYIKQLPVHELKIDKSFVSDMLYDENDAVIVRSTIDLAHNLGLKVVAEGVENAMIMEQLRELNCDVIQGHHIGQPRPLDEVEASLPPLNRGGKIRHIKDYR